MTNYYYYMDWKKVKDKKDAGPRKTCFTVNAQFKKTKKDSRDIKIRLPDRESTTEQVDGCTTQQGVSRQVRSRRMKQQKRQCLACMQQT